VSIRVRIAALTGALLLVELACFSKLSSWLFWTTDRWLAYTTAFAFVSLLLTSIIAMGSTITPSLRRQFYLGGIWLLIVQGLANVLIAYEQSLVTLPVDVVTGFFNLKPDAALKSMSIIQGGSLSVVSISMWSVVGELLRSYWAEQQSQAARLQEFDEILQEVTNE